MAEGSLDDYMLTHPIFDGLESGIVKVLAQNASEVEFNRGVLIFKQDAPAEFFYLIREGEVSVEIPSLYGAPITMQQLGPDKVLGWSWIFPPYKWHFDARATEATKAVQVDGIRLRLQCEENPRMGYELVKHFSLLMMERLSAARQRVMDVYGPDS